MPDLPEVDDLLEDGDDEDDGFLVTGYILVQAGMDKEGELQWRWKYTDIEPALALGFISVIHDELKDDIRDSIKEEDD